MIGIGGEVPDWRDARAYGYTAQLTQREWAWEFLRRNSDFQRDLTVALEHADYQEEGSSLNIVKSPVDLTEWGLIFRRFFAARCDGFLVSGALPASIADDR